MMMVLLKSLWFSQTRLIFLFDLFIFDHTHGTVLTQCHSYCLINRKVYSYFTGSSDIRGWPQRHGTSQFRALLFKIQMINFDRERNLP